MTEPLSPLKRALVAIETLQARLAEHDARDREPIAVVGIGCRFPDGIDSPATFAARLHEGFCARRPSPPLNRPGWVPDPGDALPPAHYLDEDVGAFDAGFFGISPREAMSIDPQQRLALECAWEALENAGIAPTALRRTATGVFFGITGSDYAQVQNRAANRRALIHSHYASGVGLSMVAGRIAYQLGLHGPALAVDTACSSSLVAVHLACRSLRMGECDLALTGGVNVMLSPDVTVAFQASRMLSPDGLCKAFDASADGFARGEGCGVVVLKRLRDAQADGDPIWAVVRGTALNQDGPSSGLTAPNGPQQEAVIQSALEQAVLEPVDVGYVEAHGTGTELGDPIEVQALGATYGRGRAADAPLVVGTVKTNIGHLEAAAGVAGLIKAALAVNAGTLPASLHFRTPNPLIPWDRLPVRVATERMPFPTGRDGVRRAGISSFGFSGTNAHIIVEEPPVPVSVPENAGGTEPRSVQVLPLSGLGREAVRALAARYADALARDDVGLAGLCHVAGTGRAHMRERLAIVCASESDAVAALRACAEAEDGTAAPAGARWGRAPVDAPRPVFLFTGQGAQWPGMGQALYQAEPVFRAVLDRCDAILRDGFGLELLAGIFAEGEAATAALNRTGLAQPALFALEVATAELWRSWGVVPAMVIGHSVGEYAAATVAGALSPEDGLRLIGARARLMEALPPGGVMVAVSAGRDEVEPRLAASGGRAWLAAVNGPESVVVSGDEDAVDAVVAELRQEGYTCTALRVSHAFHSHRIDPALEPLAEAASEIEVAAPRVPIISNLTGQPLRLEELRDPGYWARQARQAVQFYPGLQTAVERGHRVFLECGPAPVLCGMGARALPDPNLLWIPSMRKSQDGAEGIAAATAALYAAGVDVDWRARDEGRVAGSARIPTYPFQRESLWVRLAPPAAGTMGPARRPEAHALLGHRLMSPDAGWRWESLLDRTQPGWVADHVVFDRVVLPGAAYLEMLLAAASAGPGWEAAGLADVTIGRPLFLEETPRAVQLRLLPDGEGRARASIHSIGEGEAELVLHVEATVLRDGVRDVEADPLAEAGDRCRTELPATEFYDGLRERGLAFGPAFRGITEVRAGAGEAVGRFVIPAELAEASDVYRVHPVLLDAGLQVAAAAFPAADAGTAGRSDLYLPLAASGVTVDPAAGPPVASHVRVDGEAGAGSLTATVRLFDEAGRLAVAIDGLVLKRAAVRPGEAAEVAYAVVWVPDTGAEAQAAATAQVDIAEVARAVEAGVAPLAAREDVRAYDALYGELATLSTAYILAALRELGWDPRPGERVDAEALADTLGVLPRHRRLLRRFLAILAEDGLLRSDGDALQVVHPLPVAEDKRLAEDIAARGGGAAELELVRRCGAGLRAALVGELDPVELVFPGGDTGVLTRLYRDTPLAAGLNGLVREAVAALLAALPPGGTLRVLEVGGGTGGTTAHVLPILPPERVAYTFTDVGPAFVTRARAEFGDRPGMRFEKLDIDRDPLEQGFAAGAYDLVLATNVLHATRDVGAAAGHISALLAPGGVLLALEAVQPERWHDLTVGLLDGWWAFTDTELRPDHPLMDRDRWMAVLGRSGFPGAAAVPGAAGTTVVTRQALLLAQREADAASAAVAGGLAGTRWLVVTDRDGVGAVAGERLRERGAQVVVAADVQDGAGDPAADIAAALTAPDAEDAVPTDVAYLWPLDAQGPDASRTLEVWLGGALQLVQRLVAAGGAPPRVHVVTRGAVAIGAAGEPVLAPQATLWGLARAIRSERPELALRILDLEPGGDTTPERLGEELAEVLGAPTEPEVAVRGGRRYVPRLEPRPLPASGAGDGVPRLLTFGERGVLDELAFVPHPRQAPGAGEVEVEIEAAALNFRDVMHALGMRYVGEKLGGECVGVVRAVGAGVEHVAVGDRVVAAAGAFGDFVTLSADLAVPLPAGLAIAEAATLPMAFLTAELALVEVGRMRDGETVLIHAAAGGVGMAAVQLARAAGLRVLATAGTPYKRAAVLRLGAEHVFDSRSTAFADEVLAATDGRGVDLVLNSLAGDFIPASLRTLAPDGRLLELGKTGIWTQAQVDAEPGLAENIRYHAVDLSPLLQHEPGRIRERLEALLRRIEAGELRPLPHRIVPLARARDAFRDMAAGRHMGKVVLVRDAGAPVREDGTYLITGGLTGLGLLAAERLAARGAGQLVLLGRSEPGPEAEPVLARLRQANVRLRIVQADVRQTELLRGLVRELAEERLPLRGVVHSAGALDDALLPEQSWERFQRTFAAKVDGTEALLAATTGTPLDFLVLFSSVSGVLGSSGQANHSAANAYLDALAAQLTAAGRPALSIAWGAWRDVGAAARLGAVARVTQRGLRAIDPAWGMDVFEGMAGTETGAVIISPTDWPAFLASTGRSDPLFARVAAQSRASAAPVRVDEAGGGATIAARVAAAPPKRRLRALRSEVERCTLQILGLPEDRLVDGQQPLGELGLDSLLAVELRNALGSGLNRTLPATLLFDYPTLDALVSFLAETLELGSDGEQKGTAAREPERQPALHRVPDRGSGGSEALSVLDMIEELSDADVGRMVEGPDDE